jgi:DNA-binding MarR family transcriptional regulator
MLHLIKEVQYAAYVRLEHALRPFGVTAVQFRILSTLAHQERLSSAELGRIYNVRPQSIIKQIAPLEEKKLIRRRPATNNKRVLEVELTPRGREVLEACNSAGARLEADLLAPFSGGEQALYRELLLKVLGTLDALDGGAPPAGPMEDQWEGARPGVQRGPVRRARS